MEGKEKMEKGEMKNQRGYVVEGIVAFIGLTLLTLIVSLGMWGCPRYNVWEQGLAGEAELSRANFNRQIAVQEAHAKMESSKLLADSEVIRAEGVAKANTIIGESLKDNESYLRYLWINNLEHAQNTTIYVPTEAGLPILEAERLKR